MASFINIGLVYKMRPHLETVLETILDCLTSNKGSIGSIKYCLDDEGEDWFESDVGGKTLSDFECSSLIKHYFGQIQLTTSLLKLDNLSVSLSIEKDDNKRFQGFIISFYENELLPTYSEDNLNKVTDEIINFICSLYKSSKFDYAFCDHEASFENGSYEFEPAKYSISFLQKGLDLEIVKSNWHINGLTKRA